MLQNILLRAGEWNQISKQGKYLNVVLAAGEISARVTMLNNTTFETKLISGMAFPVPDGFQSVAFFSEASQQTKIWLGDLPLTYSPVESKVVGSSGLKSSVVTVGFGMTSRIAAADTSRKGVTLYSENDFYVGGVGLNAATAIKVKAGEPKEIGTQAEIYGFTGNPSYLTQNVSEIDSESGVIAFRDTARVNTEQVGFLEDLNRLFFRYGNSISYISASDLGSGTINAFKVFNLTYFASGVFEKDSYIYGDKNEVCSVDLRTAATTKAALIGYPVGAGSTRMASIQKEGDFILAVDTEFNCHYGTITTGVVPLVEPFKSYYWYLRPDGRLVTMKGSSIAFNGTAGELDFGVEYVNPVSWDSDARMTADRVTGIVYLSNGRTIYSTDSDGAAFLSIKTFNTGYLIKSIDAVGGVITVTTMKESDTSMGELVQSKDGGLNWSVYGVNLNDTFVNDVYFSDSGDIYLAGNGGSLERVGAKNRKVGGLSIAVMEEVN